MLDSTARKAQWPANPTLPVARRTKGSLRKSVLSLCFGIARSGVSRVRSSLWQIHGESNKGPEPRHCLCVQTHHDLGDCLFDGLSGVMTLCSWFGRQSLSLPGHGSVRVATNDMSNIAHCSTRKLSDARSLCLVLCGSCIPSEMHMHVSQTMAGFGKSLS